ncbi:MAG TPA: hypothetical protein VEG44_04180 [Candidatus Acidoferrales bacterium]|nr:hypothetical protein [Candidatus Acidoferrales bacterium]
MAARAVEWIPPHLASVLAAGVRTERLMGAARSPTGGMRTTVYLQFRDQDLREVYNKVEF